MSDLPADDGDRPRPIEDLIHELNNVLSAVLGYAEIVHGDASRGRVEERDALQILAATRRAIELADQLAAQIQGGSEVASARDKLRSERQREA